MYYAKIIVKSNYEKRGDLVLRSYVRALKKVKADLMLDGDNAFIYGVVDENGKFHELFTNEVINYNNYIYIGIEELDSVSDLEEDRIKLLQSLIQNVLFGKNNEFDFVISSMEELAKDRSIEFDAYNNFLSRINPYMKLSEDNSKLYNAYNDFLYKIEQLKVMKRLDQQRRDVDLYSVYDYEEPQREEPESLTNKVYKRLVRK